MRSGNKHWLHPADALLRGHILYTVKYLGECAVDQPKGIEVVKDAIRKMKFNKHIKRAEGQKTPKVDLTISADAVRVLDPKSKEILHQYPLHRISYCADDKSDKQMFTFIAKVASGNQHYCYVFDSEKCAEEITLTVGQAFDLAYKRFLESSASDGDVRKQLQVMQKKVQTLQFENDTLKKRIGELEKMKNRDNLEEYMQNNGAQQQVSVVGRRLENLILVDDDGQTNYRDHSTDTASAAKPILSPPPANTRIHRTNSRTTSSSSNAPNTPTSSTKLFSDSTSFPTSTDTVDPFGMQAFNPTVANADQELMDIQAGFSRGLSFGTDDFRLDDLDPLNHRL